MLQSTMANRPLATAPRAAPAHRHAAAGVPSHMPAARQQQMLRDGHLAAAAAAVQQLRRRRALVISAAGFGKPADKKLSKQKVRARCLAACWPSGAGCALLA